MLTVTDIFAGAGGSSTGAASVPGVEVKIAANHWQLAVDVHNDNHPTTDHACVDLHLEDPRNFPRTDILWASPECTKWSIANNKAKALSVAMGGDPTLFDDVPVELESSDEDEISRSRLLMFDVLRFIEHHRYRMVFVENVVDIATQAKYSAAWAAWRRGLDKLGYAYRVVSLNSMHAQLAGLPAPQSRDRLYVVAWPKGERAPEIDKALRPLAWCSRCDMVVESHQAWKPGRTVGRYRAQYVYACSCGQIVEPAWLPAASAIDWSLPAARIADRAKPLSPKTMARIREGLRRYGTPWVLNNQHGNAGSHASMPLPTQTTATNKGIVLDAIRSAPILSSTTQPLRTQATAYTRALVIEAAGNTYDMASGSGNNYLRAWPDTDPLRTLHGTASKGIVIPLRGSNTPKPDQLPLDTVTASGNHHGLLIPVEGRDGKRAASAGEVMRTQTTRNETGLLVPYYSASETAKPTDHPIGTLTCVDRYALVMRNNTGGAEMTTPVSEPFRTFTSAGHQSVLEGEKTAKVTDGDVMACRFRMLEPSEIAAGMAFPGDYRWQGTKRERVRLAGNAVTPPAARDLIHVIAESLGAAA